MREPDFYYKAKESVPLKFIPKKDGVAVGMGAYAAGAALDGTTSSLKVQVSVKDSSNNVVSTFDSISCDSLTMFRGDSSNTTAAELTLRKGFFPASTTDYVVFYWYDSSDSSTGLRIEDEKVIRILVDSPIDTPPYT